MSLRSVTRPRWPYLGKENITCVFSICYNYLAGIHENIFSTNFNGVAIHPHSWVLANLARGHVVLPAMPRASHYVSVHNTLAQWPATMEAGIVDGIELAADICQGNRFALHLKLANLSRRNFIRLCRSRKRHLVFTLLRYGSNFVPLQTSARSGSPARDEFPFLYFLYTLYFSRFLFRLRRLRHHYPALELFHHLRLQAHFRGPLGQRHLVDFVLQLQQRKKEPFRPRRASDNVHVYRYDAIHALQNRISVKRSTHAGACTHRNAPLRVRHLLPHAFQHRRHLQRHRARHDHQVGLPRRRPEHFRSKPRHIEPRSRRSDHLDRAARQSKRQRPDRALPRPVEHVVHRRNHEVLFESLIQHAHW